jgi:ABC-type transport system involved in cytochrome c biogenesis permease subunit
MATDALTIQESDEQRAATRIRTLSAGSTIAKMLLPLASLRLTVALFAMAIFLIFAGTLAQVDQDIWEVMTQYFRTWFAWIDLKVFFPPSFFGDIASGVTKGFYFPGGWVIGGAMGINLLAAHALRFKVQARGPRLMAGLAVIALGVALTWMVVVGGSGKDAIGGAAPVAWPTLWAAMKWSLVALWAAGAYALARLDRARSVERWTLASFQAVLGGVLVWIFARGAEATLGDSSMRILWQLMEGGVAGLVLLGGCSLVFRKRAGIVLLHAGVALVMANELVVHTLHVEGQMHIREGETVNFVQDIRTVELAVIDPSDPKTDDVVVVPRSVLRSGKAIDDDNLPFKVDLIQYLQNAELRRAKPDEKNPATGGAGLEWIAQRRRASAGTDAGGKVDSTAAYVKLTKKGSSEPIGEYLVGVELSPQPVKLDNKTYELALRFRRTYKPYSMRLDDVRADMYLGTQTPKNYSSDVRLVDKDQNIDREVKIWMNNPLRFADETFYQSGYNVDEKGREITTLQVVSNTGWMIPYVACMLVGTGMLAQFSITLLRFLRRRNEEQAAPAKQPRRERGAKTSEHTTALARGLEFYFPAVVVLVFGVWVAYSAWPKHAPISQMQLDEFGRLPAVYEGRAKPLDTVARNMLRYLSLKQTFVDANGKTQPAIKWFLNVVSDNKDARDDRVFRIDNLELLETLGLKRREGYRYSVGEFAGHLGELERQAEMASSLEPGKATGYQKKVMELVKKLRLVMLVKFAFDVPEPRGDNVEEKVRAFMAQLDALSRLQPPLVVPPDSPKEQWQAYAVSWFNGVKNSAHGGQRSPAMESITSILAAYRGDHVEQFNSQVAKYQTWLTEHKPQDLDEGKIGFEAFFNALEPFYWALVLYVVAFVLVALGWLGWGGPLNRAAFWLIVLALAVHTFALCARIYISGRPPVTNLYSSAVFIGWGGVMLGLVLEMVYRLGIGNVIASVAGFTTLLIANFLAGLTDGDTLGVLQAVLDTQFWLATHVVCETLGYTTTFIAGLLGLVYILRGVLTPSLSAGVGKDLSRMIYGTLCFAMFFSFIGTVLGGLWADDSWGRFWGWDPKENGALMIVLWNALVLHARWGGIVKERGLASLAVLGNIVTGWSWFGVNELGVGLHSYGFTDGVLFTLGVFATTQLATVALALIPKQYWWSLRSRPTA